MNRLVEAKLDEWTRGKDPRGARVAIFERIRDIPYAVVPELVDPEGYVDILLVNRGSCTPKHLLLCEMYRRLGLTVLYVVYPFRWDELEVEYSPRLRRLAEAVPMRYHLACKVEIEDRLILVDATVDPGLVKLGLHVNKAWDGLSDTQLPIEPHGEEQLFHPCEAQSVRGA
jgi:transglutaminase-like putative cysteine protease